MLVGILSIALLAHLRYAASEREADKYAEKLLRAEELLRYASSVHEVDTAFAMSCQTRLNLRRVRAAKELWPPSEAQIREAVELAVSEATSGYVSAPSKLTSVRGDGGISTTWGDVYVVMHRDSATERELPMVVLILREPNVLGVRVLIQDDAIGCTAGWSKPDGLSWCDVVGSGDDPAWPEALNVLRELRFTSYATARGAGLPK